MFFRFGSALILVVVTSLLGIFVEKQNLTLRREISRQHYRMDVLQEEHARLRLRSQQLAAVERLFATIEDEESGLIPSQPGTISFQPASTPPSDHAPDDDSSRDASTDDDAPESGIPGGDNEEHSPASDQKSAEPDSSDLTTRRVPLLFWQKPVSDPRLKRGSR
ncbi:MAG: hypothetical protein HQ518_15880 [Rhodopirellula sp.]|nr:hypothetical protein [Rhodopirellula sp.]